MFAAPTSFRIALNTSSCLLAFTRQSPPPVFFFLNDPAPPETYPLPLHDPLPISKRKTARGHERKQAAKKRARGRPGSHRQRQPPIAQGARPAEHEGERESRRNGRTDRGQLDA